MQKENQSGKFLRFSFVNSDLFNIYEVSEYAPNLMKNVFLVNLKK